MTNRGYVKLYRKLKENVIYTNSRAVHVFIECLLRASHKRRVFYMGREKMELKPGDFVLGRHEFSESVSMSPSTAWHWIEELEKNGILNTNRTAKGTVASVINWEEYQACNSRNHKKKTPVKQQVDTNNNVNNDKNVENDNKRDSPEQIPYGEIVAFLNKQAEREFKPSTKITRKKIRARVNEGFKVEDFKTVICKKVAEWKGDEEMEQYLRPQTLFSNKFESYLNQPHPGNGNYGGQTEEEYLSDLVGESG